MKKTVSLLLCFCLCLLTGCTERPAVPTAAAEPVPVPVTAAPSSAPLPTEAPTPEPTETPAPDEDISVTVDTVRSDVYDADGTLLLSFRSDEAAVTLPGNKEAEERINEALRLDRERFYASDPAEDMLSGHDAMASAAREDRAMAAEGGWDWTSFAQERSIAVSRADRSLISFVYTDYMHTGGVHGNYGSLGRSFDARTGEGLTLEALSDRSDFAAWCAERLAELSHGAEYADRGFYEGYEAYLPELTASDCWYFSDGGLVFAASPYFLAPYAAGEILFTVPYAELTGVLKAAYLPLPNDSAADGVLTGALEEAAGVYTFTADDGTGGEGARVVFRAEGSVKDVTAERVAYSEYDGAFYPVGTAVYLSALRDGESLCLYTWIPDAAPNLRLTFTGRDGTVTRYLTQSGEDGSLVLAEW